MQTERYKQVKQVLLKRGFGNLLGLEVSKEAYKQSPEERLKLALEELGGGFILLGQLLKFRIDLVPVTYCKALARLRDKGTPLSYEEFEDALTKQYSRPLETIFSHVEKQPFLVDVISQTHEAILVNGEKVHVKIIKQNAKLIIKEDLRILAYLAKKITLPIDTTYILSELDNYVKNKFDLQLEETFLTNSGKYASSYIPQVASTISNKNVLVVQHIKKKTIEHLKKKIKRLEGDIHFIQGEFILSFIGVLLLAIGLFLPQPLANIFIYTSIACFILVFIFLTQHEK